MNRALYLLSTSVKRRKEAEMEVNRENILAVLGDVKNVDYYDDQGNPMGVYGRLVRLNWGEGEKKRKLCLWVTPGENPKEPYLMMQIELAHIRSIG